MSRPPTAASPPRSMTSLDRGLTILTSVAERGEISAAALSRHLGIPLSTLYRHLSVLCAHELVVEDQGLYTTGWRAVGMSGRNLTHTVLASLSGDVLSAAAESLEETVVITVRAGSHAVCLRQVRGARPHTISFHISQLLPLYAGAGQRILLAFSPPALLAYLAQRGLACPTGRQYTPQELGAACEQARRRGYEVSRGELIKGALAVAVPVLIRGEIVCSLTAAGPATCCDNSAWIDRAVRVLTRGANELSAGLKVADAGDDADVAPSPLSTGAPASVRANTDSTAATLKGKA